MAQTRRAALLSLLVASTAPACSGGGETSSSSAPSVSGPRLAPSPPPPSQAIAPQPGADFSKVAEGYAIAIHPLGAGAFVDTAAFVAPLDDGPIVQDPDVTKTALTSDDGRVIVTNAFTFSSYWGSYPDQLLANGLTKPGIFGRVKGIWTSQDPLRDGESLLDITAWDDKRALAAIRMDADIRFALVNSAGGVTVPAPGKPTQTQGECAVRMDPASALKLAGLPSGHLFAFGVECKTGRPIAERWQPKADRGESALLAGIPDNAAPIAAAAAAPDEAYAIYGGGHGYLATWDGKAWHAEESPFGVGRELMVSSDGTAWAIGDAGLFEHPKGGAWTKLPITGKPTSMWAKNADVVWVVTDDETLWRKGAYPGPQIKLPARGDVETALTRDQRWLATNACDKIYVHLLAIGPSGGDAPKSFSGLTNAVKGDAALEKLGYVVEEVGPSQIIGAKVPSLEVADKLILAFTAKNDRAKPMIFCHEPIVKGKLSVE